MTALKKIYTLRYKKALLLLSGLILFIYGYSSFHTMKGWQWRNEYYHSEAFIREFTDSADTRIRDYDEKGQPIYYKNIKEFQDTQLTVFQHYPDSYLSQIKAAIPNQKVYYPGKVYTTNSDFFILLFPLVFLAGFAFFFVDQKTNFNAFLFSLPMSRTRLFFDKIRFIALPFVGVLAIGSMFQVLFYTWGFPNEYMNATFLQLLYSGFSHWLLLSLIFAMGIFFGTLLNHLILAPIMVVLSFFAFTLINGIYNDLAWVIHHYFPSLKFYELNGLLVIWPGKTASPWWMILLLGSVIGFFLYFSHLIFKNLSLENTGQLLSVPRFKFLVFIVASLFTSFWFTFGLTVIGYPLSEGLRLPYKEIALIIGLCSGASFGLIYYPEIQKKWQTFHKKNISTN